MDIQTLLDQPGKLPTVPKVTQKLIESFSDEDALQKGMEVKSVEFVKTGAQVYHKV